MGTEDVKVTAMNMYKYKERLRLYKRWPRFIFHHNRTIIASGIYFYMQKVTVQSSLIQVEDYEHSLNGEVSNRSKKLGSNETTNQGNKSTRNQATRNRKHLMSVAHLNVRSVASRENFHLLKDMIINNKYDSDVTQIT